MTDSAPYEKYDWTQGQIITESDLDRLEDVAINGGNSILISETKPNITGNKIWINSNPATYLNTEIITSDDLSNIVAPLFSSSASYKTGDYVLTNENNEIKLWIFINNHPAGTWSGTDVIQMPISNTIYNIKNNMNDLQSLVEGLADKNIIFNEWLTDTGSAQTKWFENIFTTSESQENLYVFMYGTENIGADVSNYYYARVLAYFSDGTTREVARITALNKPFFIKADQRDSEKVITGYTIVCTRYNTTSIGTANSAWGVLVYSERTSVQNNLLNTLNNKQILLNKSGYVGSRDGTTNTVWFDYVLPPSATDFWIRIDAANNRVGTLSHLARLIGTYTDNTTTVTYLDNLQEAVHITTNELKTINQWSLVLYTSEEAQWSATEWQFIIWQEPAINEIHELQTNTAKMDTIIKTIENETTAPISFTWEHGGIDNATGATNNNGSLSRSRDITYYDGSKLVSVTNNSTSQVYAIYYTYSNNTYTFSSSTGISAGTTLTFTTDKYIRFDVRGNLDQANLITGQYYSPIVKDVLHLKNNLQTEIGKALYSDKNIVFNNWLKHTGSSQTRWFENLFTKPAQDENLYVLMYGVENIANDVSDYYYARVLAYFSDGTSSEVARITALNKPFFIYHNEQDAAKTITSYTIVCTRYQSTSIGTVESAWGVLVYTDKPRINDNLLNLINDKQILINYSGYVGSRDGTTNTKWLDYIIPASANDFWIRIDTAEGRIGTLPHFARLIGKYTDNTSLVVYLDNLEENVHIVTNSLKTISNWALVLYTSETAMWATTYWRIIAWKEPQKTLLQRLAELYQEPDILKIEGTTYGPVSKDYKATKTNENWQSASYAEINSIPCGNYKFVYSITFGRHGLGKRAGMIQFFDTNGDAIGSADAVTATETIPGSPIIQGFVIPEEAATIYATFEGISNATTAGHASVIGEIYYVHDCYVFLTNTPILNSKCNWLDDEWNAAVDSVRAAQNTAITFAIQTDTHFSVGHPPFIGKQLNQFAQLVGLDFVANLGDIVSGYNGRWDAPEYTRMAAKTIMNRYLEGLPCPFFTTIGNHEKGTMYAAANTDVDTFLQTELYAMYTKQAINSSARIVAEPGKSYYYADLNGFRVICMFTNDHEPYAATLSADQLTWFTTKALNTTLPVLLLAHIPMIPDVPHSGAYSDTYGTAITALETFKNNGGTVIACIYGHTHTQWSQKVNGIWHITCTCTEPQFKTAEVFMIDPTTYNITTIGLGDAQSRTFAH